MTDTRLATHPDDFERLDPLELRRRYVVEDLFAPGEVRFCLSQQDRVRVVPMDQRGGQSAVRANADQVEDAGAGDFKGRCALADVEDVLGDHRVRSAVGGYHALAVQAHDPDLPAVA